LIYANSPIGKLKLPHALFPLSNLERGNRGQGVGGEVVGNRLNLKIKRKIYTGLKQFQYIQI
jgi:hypothetical protein